MAKPTPYSLSKSINSRLQLTRSTLKHTLMNSIPRLWLILQGH